MWILRGKGSLTAKKLAKMIGCYTRKERLPKFKHMIVNYGSTYEGAYLNNRCVFNKLRQLQITRDNDILTPKIYLPGDDIPQEAFPILARRKYHTQGKDIVYVENERKLQQLPRTYDFLVKYIDKQSEYRIHVLGDTKVFTSVKVSAREDANPIIRCHQFGWNHVEYNGQYRDILIDIARKCCKVLRFDFGAVDLIRKKNKIYFLEINSAPSLEKRKLELYVQYLEETEQTWR